MRNIYGYINFFDDDAMLWLQVFDACREEVAAFHQSLVTALREGELRNLRDLQHRFNVFYDSLAENEVQRSQLSAAKVAINDIIHKHAETPKKKPKKTAKPIPTFQGAFDAAIDALLKTNHLTTMNASNEAIASSEVGQIMQSIFSYGSKHGTAIAKKFPGNQNISSNTSSHQDLNKISHPIGTSSSTLARPAASSSMAKLSTEPHKRDYSKISGKETEASIALINPVPQTSIITPSSASKDDDRKRLKGVSNPTTTLPTSTAISNSYIGVTVKKINGKSSREYSCEVSRSSSTLADSSTETLRQVKIHGISISLGTYVDIVEAARAHDRALIRALGPSACHAALSNVASQSVAKDDLVNFPVVNYATDSLALFTCHDVALRSALFSSGWTGLKLCDFSEVLLGIR